MGRGSAGLAQAAQGWAGGKALAPALHSSHSRIFFCLLATAQAGCALP